MKTEITKKEYLTAYALLHLAHEKINELRNFEGSLASVLGVEDDGSDYFGHVSDAIYSEYDLKTLLNKLGIKRKRAGRPSSEE